MAFALHQDFPQFFYPLITYLGGYKLGFNGGEYWNYGVCYDTLQFRQFSKPHGRTYYMRLCWKVWVSGSSETLSHTEG